MAARAGGCEARRHQERVSKGEGLMKGFMRIAMALAALLAAAASFQAAAQMLTVTNTYPDKDVWITTYQSGRTFKLQSFCVPRGKTVSQHHVQYGNGFNVRAEVTAGANCAQPTICDTTMGIEGRGHMQYRNPADGIYVHRQYADPNACYISWRKEQDIHQAIVENKYPNRAVWVTFYDYLHQTTGTQIFKTGCVLPGKTESFFHNWFQNGAYKIRAEVMTGSRGTGNDCGGSRVCDTDANPMRRAGTMDKPVASRIYPNGGNCFIDWADRAAPPALKSVGSILPAGQLLTANQFMPSPSNRYFAIMHPDGNLCVYRGTPQNMELALWCTNRMRSDPVVMVLQGDGNLCTYSASNVRSNPAWCSMRTAQGGQFFLAQQNDGNLCVYPGPNPQSQRGAAIWCHNTNVGR
jgi:hypothetical protein